MANVLQIVVTIAVVCYTNGLTIKEIIDKRDELVTVSLKSPHATRQEFSVNSVPKYAFLKLMRMDGILGQSSSPHKKRQYLKFTVTLNFKIST